MRKLMKHQRQRAAVSLTGPGSKQTQFHRLQEFKAQHGDVYAVTVAGETMLFRCPTLKETQDAEDSEHPGANRVRRLILTAACAVSPSGVAVLEKLAGRWDHAEAFAAGLFGRDLRWEASPTRLKFNCIRL
jgi:hypothetical protein